MTNDALLDILKWALLGLLYLFFARVLWAVWSELRAPRPTTDRSQMTITAAPDDPTMAAAPPTAAAVRPGKAPKAPKAPKGTGPKPPKPYKPPKGPRGSITALVVIEPRSQRGRAFPLDTEITVGRATTCTIALPDDPYISTLHAHVVRDAGQVHVEDLGSTNGSFHNGERITQRRLVKQGDRLQFGQTLLEAQ